MNIPYDVNPGAIATTQQFVIPDKFVSIFEIQIPYDNTVYKFWADWSSITPYIIWGDGEKKYFNEIIPGQVSHTYKKAGYYTVIAVGDNRSLQLGYEVNSASYLRKIIRITQSITDFSYMFRNCIHLTQLPEDFQIPYMNQMPEGSNYNTYTTSYGIGMFQGCKNLERLPQNFALPSGFYYATNMFNGCNKLEANVQQIVSKIYPQNYSNYTSMFQDCYKLYGTPPANKFWQSKIIKSYSKCFLHCISLDNLGDIPVAWGRFIRQYKLYRRTKI